MSKQSPSTHVDSKQELVEYLASGCKPKSDWKLGTEHEKFGYRLDDLRPLPYEGERSIRAILEALADQFGWQPVLEDGRTIALVDETGASITLEPGGQLELSGAVLDNIHQTCTEVYTHLKQVRAVSEPLGISFIGMGFQPKWRREEMEWMPKGRYRIMREYMNKVGTLGVDMMTRTCTIQVNMDFSSEADMVHKFRTALALQPIATALFANSPFTDGRPNGFVSYRSRVWEDTDPDRTGMLPWVFEGEMGFEKYVDYMLDVPMYFVYRDGAYLDASGQSFRDFLDGRLPVLPGEKPTLKDWEDHLTTAFPEVRLKRFLEMRGADGGPWRRICALPALWTGLLYHQETLDAAWDLASAWSMEERLRLREEVPRLGLKAEIRGRSVLDIAAEVIELANRGLTARARLNGAGDNETGFLSPLSQVVENRETPAERKLALYRGPWKESVDPIFFECSY
ncbi:MAG: glutamate--cysteine ligase [Lysobacterales bacterium]